jgi:hypothetical protein
MTLGALEALPTFDVHFLAFSLYTFWLKGRWHTLPSHCMCTDLFAFEVIHERSPCQIRLQGDTCHQGATWTSCSRMPIGRLFKPRSFQTCVTFHHCRTGVVVCYAYISILKYNTHNTWTEDPRNSKTFKLIHALQFNVLSVCSQF